MMFNTVDEMKKHVFETDDVVQVWFRGAWRAYPEHDYLFHEDMVIGCVLIGDYDDCYWHYFLWNKAGVIMDTFVIPETIETDGFYVDPDEEIDIFISENCRTVDYQLLFDMIKLKVIL
ncbi:MAG: hypothetical protein KAS32_14320 [Candidatus Peribacteraceae bacterium]|nr:hypothetical protein [Candidatus Peribacteraceae bacterium]